MLPAEKNASEPKHTVKAKDNDKETEMKAENGTAVSAESGKKPERRKGSRTAVRTSHKAESKMCIRDRAGSYYPGEWLCRFPDAAYQDP